MKSKLILLIIFGGVFSSQSLIAVEKAETNVENILICEAVTNDKTYLINLAWGRTHTHLPDGRAPSIKSKIYYKILEKESGLKFEDTFTNSFREYAKINENASNIELKGGYHLHKRIGQIQKDAIIKINKSESRFELDSIHLSHYEDWGDHFTAPCDQPISKLCNGNFPHENKEYKLEFNSSNCSIVKTKN